jgi:hypothetical protein
LASNPYQRKVNPYFSLVGSSIESRLICQLRPDDSMLKLLLPRRSCGLRPNFDAYLLREK